MALPGVGAAALLAFHASWALFFLPLLMLHTADKFVVLLGLFRTLIAYTHLEYGMLTTL